MFSIFWCYLHFFVFVQNWNFKNFKGTRTLCEKCPNKEKFLVRIFLYLDLVQTDTPYLSVFSPNTGKYGPEITRYLDTFHAVRLIFWLF